MGRVSRTQRFRFSRSCTMACLLAGASATLPAQTVLFVPQTQAGVGADPVALTVGNFTGDGRIDVVTANQAAGTVTLLRGLGNGFFQNLTNQAVSAGPRAVASGDFNGDGRLDVAVADFTGNSVSVLLGTGAGTFIAVGGLSASGPTSIAVGDFNRDGRLDLAVAEAGSGTVSIFLGIGNGAFQFFAKLPVGSRPASIAAEDFNGDGKLDLAVANTGSNNVSVLLGNGNGTFRAALNSSAGPQPASVVVGDFNGDGVPDLALANATGFAVGSVSLLLGVGNGGFQSPRTFATVGSTSFVTAADFNQDGKLDLAVANTGASTVSIFLGLGNGSFAPPLNFGTGGGPAWIGVADLNGDGKPDLLVANSQSSTVSVLLNRTNPAAQSAVAIHSVVNSASFQGGGVAPGEMVTIVGTGLGPSQAMGTELNGPGLIATALGQTQVLFDGIAAPLVSAGTGQVRAMAPYGIGSRSSTEVVVENNGQASAPLSVAVSPSAPALFTLDGSGVGPAAALNQDASVNTHLHPAAQGSVIVLYATGAGETSPPGVDGVLASGSLALAALPVSVTIGGRPAKVLYAGAAPGLVSGIMQVNVQLPEGLGSGAVPVLMQVGDSLSQPGVTVSLE